MKNVVVTGGNGFVGSNLVRKLVNENYNVSIIEKLGVSIEGIEDIENKVNIFFYDGDINKLIGIFEQIKKVDTVFHLASLVKTSHNPEDISNLIESNITFGTHLLEAMYTIKCFNMINTSTYWQHYNNENYNPVDLYAATKEAFEKIIEFYVKAKKFNVITLELYDNNGRNDKRKKIMNILKESFLINKPLNLTLGEQIINLIYIDDLIDGYMIAETLLEKNMGHSKYSLTSENPTTLKSIVQIFKEVMNKDLNVKFGAINYKEREIMYPWDKGVKLPKWSAKISLREGIKKFMEV